MHSLGVSPVKVNKRSAADSSRHHAGLPPPEIEPLASAFSLAGGLPLQKQLGLRSGNTLVVVTPDKETSEAPSLRFRSARALRRKAPWHSGQKRGGRVLLSEIVTGRASARARCASYLGVLHLGGSGEPCTRWRSYSPGGVFSAETLASVKVSWSRTLYSKDF